MIDKLVEHNITLKKIWGIHIEESCEGDYRIDALLLEYRKGAVFVLGKRHLEKLGQLVELASQRLPLSLSYSGYRVLFKSTEAGRDGKLEDLLPGVNHEEFYNQSLTTVAGRFFCVVRKSHFDPIIQQISDLGLNIVSIALGPANMFCLSPFIGMMEEQDVVAGRFSIHFNEGKIINITRERKIQSGKTKVGDDYLDATELIPYANSLSVFTRGKDLVDESLHNDWSHLLMEGKHRTFFKRAFPVLLGVVFSFLLASFIVFQIQTQRNNELSVTLGNYREQLVQLEKLKRSFDDKQLIQSNIRLNNGLFLSYYADRIAESIGERIRLTSLIINPEQKSNSSRRQNLQFEQGKIQLSGICDSPSDLNEWLINLRKLKIIDNVENQSYRFDDQKEKGVFNLSLKIVTP